MTTQAPSSADLDRLQAQVSARMARTDWRLRVVQFGLLGLGLLSLGMGLPLAMLVADGPVRLLCLSNSILWAIIAMVAASAIANARATTQTVSQVFGIADAWRTIYEHERNNKGRPFKN